jgi:hypothetical protein
LLHPLHRDVIAQRTLNVVNLLFGGFDLTVLDRIALDAIPLLKGRPSSLVVLRPWLVLLLRPLASRHTDHALRE